jgi:hypothetical protein
VFDPEFLVRGETLASAPGADKPRAAEPDGPQNAAQGFVLYARTGHDLATAPASHRSRAASSAHPVQGPFEEPGAHRQDRVAHGKLARLQVKRNRRLDAPQQGVQFFILFRVGLVFF